MSKEKKGKKKKLKPSKKDNAWVRKAWQKSKELEMQAKAQEVKALVKRLYQLLFN